MQKVATKLQYVQTNLHAPKGQRNNFGNYNYRSCEDILTAVKPLLDSCKAVIVITDDLQMIGDRFYVKARARFICSESGEELCNSAFARESLTKKGMDDAQVTGSVSSYARKYALNGLLLIDDVKDADHTNTHGKGNAPQQQAQPNTGTIAGF